MRDLIRRLAVLVNRAVFISRDNNSKNQQWTVKGVFGQSKQVEVFEPFGLTSGPPANAELVRFCLEGQESHSIALGATGGGFRPRDADTGEVIVYSQFDQESRHRLEFRESQRAISLLSGDNRLTLDNNGFTLEVGGATLVFDADGLRSNRDGRFEDVSVTTHRHGGVRGGNSTTGEPV